MIPCETSRKQHVGQGGYFGGLTRRQSNGVQPPSGAVHLSEVLGVEILLDVIGTAVDGVVEGIQIVGAQLGMDALRAELLADAEIDILRRRLANGAHALPFIAERVREGLALVVLVAACHQLIGVVGRNALEGSGD